MICNFTCTRCLYQVAGTLTKIYHGFTLFVLSVCDFPPVYFHKSRPGRYERFKGSLRGQEAARWRSDLGRGLIVYPMMSPMRG